MIPQWVQKRGYQDLLLELVQQQRFDEKGQKKILQWLQTTGTDVAKVQQEEEGDRFFEAYYVFR